MTDIIIVGVIVAAAAFFVIRRFVKSATSSGSCGCSGCGSSCTPQQKQDCGGD
ncbi:FeoB-associated Cys-rich membrane protein [Desulfovibrio oxyclinae]|uniref:FeoB-associated Cys-rich membrane protein n=1 Tax=Desulfovibrio oxyclinae TaxID=63560 RepID=UPI00035FFBE4|nr:FeoB-associated Cys-rich membrane protein [Desulfovibrio oxyclinae]